MAASSAVPLWFEPVPVNGRADFTLRLDLHHLMRMRFDADALIEAGERAMLELAPAVRARLV